jgi:hypothetical protein
MLEEETRSPDSRGAPHASVSSASGSTPEVITLGYRDLRAKIDAQPAGSCYLFKRFSVFPV